MAVILHQSLNYREKICATFCSMFVNIQDWVAQHPDLLDVRDGKISIKDGITTIKFDGTLLRFIDDQSWMKVRTRYGGWRVLKVDRYPDDVSTSIHGLVEFNIAWAYQMSKTAPPQPIRPKSFRDVRPCEFLSDETYTSKDGITCSTSTLLTCRVMGIKAVSPNLKIIEAYDGPNDALFQMIGRSIANHKLKFLSDGDVYYGISRSKRVAQWKCDDGLYFGPHDKKLIHNAIDYFLSWWRVDE